MQRSGNGVSIFLRSQDPSRHFRPLIAERYALNRIAFFLHTLLQPTRVQGVSAMLNYLDSHTFCRKQYHENRDSELLERQTSVQVVFGLAVDTTPNYLFSLAIRIWRYHRL
jgi:hypothetical protein